MKIIEYLLQDERKTKSLMEVLDAFNLQLVPWRSGRIDVVENTKKGGDF